MCTTQHLGKTAASLTLWSNFGSKGIVNAGLGHANVPNEVMNSLIAAKKAGAAVVVDSRVGSGLITPIGKFTREGFVSAMLHNPQKARILLILLHSPRQTIPKRFSAFSTSINLLSFVSILLFLRVPSMKNTFVLGCENKRNR